MELFPKVIGPDQVCFSTRKGIAMDGFKGFGSLLIDLCRVIKDQGKECMDDSERFPLPFNKLAYERIAQFMKTGWGTLQTKIAAPLLPAYNSLFGHMFRTYDSMCSRQYMTMDMDLQMALLAQTWRVIDVLSPPCGRDPHLCVDSHCCRGYLKTRLKCSTWEDFQNLEVHVYDVFTNESDCMVEVEDICLTQDGMAFKIETYRKEFTDYKIEFVGLRLGKEAMSIIDVQLTANLSWIFSGQLNE